MLAISDEQIDQQVARFRFVADASVSNLLELESLETLQLVRTATFTGATRVPVAEALAALDQLVVLQPRLTELADHLEQLWTRSPRPKHDQRRQIEELLTGASITLPARAIELDDRSLFTPAEVSERVTAESLIATMNELFVRARTTLLAIDDVWLERLAQITALRQQTAADLARAGRLGEPTALIAAIDGRLAAVAEQLSSDPLGSAAAIDDGLAAEVDEVTRHLDRVEQLRRDLPADLRSAAERLADIVRLADQAERAADDALTHIAGLDVERLDRAALHDERTGLIPWLQRLVDLSAEGRWRAARVGLDRWLAAADEVTSLLVRTRDLSGAALDRREELQGRLDSYRSIAGTRLEEHAELGRLHAEAQASLYRAPADLAEAADLVRRFLAAVRSTT